jgi:hypothetical protein
MKQSGAKPSEGNAPPVQPIAFKSPILKKIDKAAKKSKRPKAPKPGKSIKEKLSKEELSKEESSKEDSSKEQRFYPPASFLGLALELRFKIYKYLLVFESGIRLGLPAEMRRGTETLSLDTERGVVRARRGLGEGKAGASVQLLYCSKQIYHEAIDILYKDNVFSANFATSFLPFSKLFKQPTLDTFRALGTIHHVRLDLEMFNLQRYGRQFSHLENLKTVTLTRVTVACAFRAAIMQPPTYTEQQLVAVFGRTPVSCINDFVKDLARRWRDMTSPPTITMELKCRMNGMIQATLAHVVSASFPYHFAK